MGETVYSTENDNSAVMSEKVSFVQKKVKISIDFSLTFLICELVGKRVHIKCGLLIKSLCVREVLKTIKLLS